MFQQHHQLIFDSIYQTWAPGQPLNPSYYSVEAPHQHSISPSCTTIPHLSISSQSTCHQSPIISSPDNYKSPRHHNAQDVAKNVPIPFLPPSFIFFSSFSRCLSNPVILSASAAETVVYRWALLWSSSALASFHFSFRDFFSPAEIDGGAIERVSYDGGSCVDEDRWSWLGMMRMFNIL